MIATVDYITQEEKISLLDRVAYRQLRNCNLLKIRKPVMRALQFYQHGRVTWMHPWLQRILDSILAEVQYENWRRKK